MVSWISGRNTLCASGVVNFVFNLLLILQFSQKTTIFVENILHACTGGISGEPVNVYIRNALQTGVPLATGVNKSMYE